MDRKNKTAPVQDRRGTKEPPMAKSHSSSASRGDRRQRSKQSQPQQGGERVLDQRLPTMFFDAISSVSAAIASAIATLPYIEARQAMAVDEEETCELTRVIQEVAKKNPAFFKENEAAIEFSVVWAAVHAAHFDNFFAEADSGVEKSACSPREAFFLAAMIIAPLLILAVVSIVHHTRRV